MEARTLNGIGYWVKRSDGRPWLVVSHGAFGDHSEFVPFLETLGEQHSVLLWDLPGHGASRTIAPPRLLEDYARLLGQVLDHEGVKEATLFGFSFGGMVTQSFAQLFPARTTALLVYGAVPIFLMKMPPIWVGRLWLWLEGTLRSRSSLETTFARQCSANPQMQSVLRLQLAAHSPTVRPALWAAMLNGVYFDPEYRFACRVAHLGGAGDDGFPGARKAIAAWRERIPANLVCEVGEAGHLAHRERPEAFRDALRYLLNQLQQPS